jgi:Histidine kinase-, DNA gyrase B-, and HSP90-like ATPase
VGETRVDLQHLLEDLRDAYTGALEETILTEVVANSLDSGARCIRLLIDPAAADLTVLDDGRGMQRRELARYHDVAASTKARGDGIGFAGVGIKLGLLWSLVSSPPGAMPATSTSGRAPSGSRDLERVLEDLADDFPLLRSLVDQRPGGQKRLLMRSRGREHVPAPLFANLEAGGSSAGAPVPPPSGEDAATPPAVGAGAGIAAPRVGPGAARRPGAAGTGTSRCQRRTSCRQRRGSAGTGRRRPARYGLLVQFESRRGDPELARLVDSTIWINDAHPAFTRASASRSLGYHTALAVALALAPLAVETADDHAIITQFLAHWGSAHGAPGAARRPRRKR